MASSVLRRLDCTTVDHERRMTAVELCAGAGGQALGLERAGFEHVGLVEIDPWASHTLRTNRPEWPVTEGDVREFSVATYENLTLLAGGVPCPPFSMAGKRLGHLDERDLFPAALDRVEQALPEAVLLENVRGLLDPIFVDYRRQIQDRLAAAGYWSEWRLLNASDFGVPQLRPRAVLVALRESIAPHFTWPRGGLVPPTVGEALFAEMASAGWPGASAWAKRASQIAPTLVGGSRKHGGPDLGPTRAKQAWAKLGVNGHLLALEPPGPTFPADEMPMLTVRMAATIQGFPADWVIEGRKTAAYRQVGNAFPPPVAEAVGTAIRDAVMASRQDEPLPARDMTAVA